jgi:hypothetical protein
MFHAGRARPRARHVHRCGTGVFGSPGGGLLGALEWWAGIGTDRILRTGPRVVGILTVPILIPVMPGAAGTVAGT